MKTNLTKTLFGDDFMKDGMSATAFLDALLTKATTREASRQQYHRVRRIHRRLEAFLLHPLSDKVIHELKREQLETARNILRNALGYSEGLSQALGQQSIDDEVEVRLQPDGFYAFRIRPDCNVEEFEAGLYSSAI